MIIEIEDLTTGVDGSYWAYASARGLLDRAYDRGLGRGPDAGESLWFVVGTGKPRPGRATIRFTLARGAPPDDGPTSQADAQSRYSSLLADLTPGNKAIWLCENDGTRLWGRRLYGARSVRLVSVPSAAWYYVEAELDLEGHYILTSNIVTDQGVQIVTDSGEPIYAAIYKE